LSLILILSNSEKVCEHRSSRSPTTLSSSMYKCSVLLAVGISITIKKLEGGTSAVFAI